MEERPSLPFLIQDNFARCRTPLEVKIFNWNFQLLSEGDKGEKNLLTIFELGLIGKVLKIKAHVVNNINGRREDQAIKKFKSYI